MNMRINVMESFNLRCVLATVAFVVLATAVQAQPVQNQPAIEVQGAGTYSFRIGDTVVTALSDGSVPQDLHKLLVGTTNARTDALLRTGFQANPVEASINVFLFKISGRTVLVDTGSGDLFPKGLGGKLLESLAAAGVRPEEITDVLITHAHGDHMGGLVRDGNMAFPNATVHVAKADVDFFQDRSNSAKAHYGMNYFDDYFASLKRYVDAGKVKTFEGEAEIMPGVQAEVHPGHTPGSAFYTLQSKGESIVFVGDIFHVSSGQFTDPSITITYDVDPARLASVRKKAFADFSRDRTLIAVPHASFPGVGHVRRVSSGYEWAPELHPVLLTPA